VATFIVLNLFIGVVVSSMQAEAMRRRKPRVHEEAAPILAEVKEPTPELPRCARMAGRRRRR
jgi:hypothetical protein